MSKFLHPDSVAGQAPAPFAPFRLLLGIVALGIILLGLILVQGYFIALAQLDRQQSALMLYPLYIYAFPAYYYFSRWQGRKVPDKAYVLAITQAISSFLLVSFINVIWLELPFAHSLTEAYILTCYVAISVLGAAQGRKKPLTTP